MVSPIWSVVAEIDEARLGGMECESIPCKALTQNAEDPLGIEEVLERQHGVVSEADSRPRNGGRRPQLRSRSMPAVTGQSSACRGCLLTRLGSAPSGAYKWRSSRC